MIIQGNALHLPLKDCTVQCCVTSPPYYGLRDYGTAKWQGGDPNCDHNPQKPDGGDRADRTLPLGRGGIYKDVCRCGAIRIDDQIGLEQTPDEYVAKLVQVFREVKRVLKDDGILFLNLGDSYASNGKSAQTDEATGWKHGPLENEKRSRERGCATSNDLKPKDLIGIPWLVAFALRADGWYLRSDIIWAKPNPMPESVKDRPTKAHEYLFLMTKSAKYYYDNEAILEPVAQSTVGRGPVDFGGEKGRNYKPDKNDPNFRNGNEQWGRTYDYSKSYKMRGFKTKDQLPDNQHHGADIETGLPARNKRSVWTVNTQPFKGAHFAVMPEKLVEPCVLAGSRPGDLVLDPFAGSGTVGVVAQKLGRQFVGIELNPDYVKLAEKRLLATPQSLFNQSILQEQP